MAASILRPCSSLSHPSRRSKKLECAQVRSQSFRDDGTSENMVDGNTGVLRARIAQVRMKETCTSGDTVESLKTGWNNYKHQPGRSYASTCVNSQLRRQKYRNKQTFLRESLQLMGAASGALGFVFLTGSICLCLVSLVAHHLI